MPRGRKPKPQMIKKIEGNRSKVANSALAMEEPQGKGQPRMPPGMSADEQELWLDVVASLPVGLLSRADENTIERAARYWSMFREAADMVSKTGLMVRSNFGPVKNPALAIMNQAAKQLQAAGSELGLSPVARARLVAPKNWEDDPMTLLLGGDDDGAWKHNQNDRT